MVYNHRIDFRSFGTIGFQAAPNGLWLGKQGYLPQSKLLERLSKAAVESGLTISAITTEDDRVVPGFPEDRFGFLASQIGNLPQGYTGEKIDDVLMRVETPFVGCSSNRVIYWLNSQTITPEGDSHGVKLHVVGANDFPNKRDSLPDLVKRCNDRGLLTFLINPGLDEDARKLADTAVEYCTGVITSDSNNVFPYWMRHIPKFGGSFKEKSKRVNESNYEYAWERKKPGIAVSSASWMHELGNSFITISLDEGSLKSGEALLNAMNERLERRAYYLNFHRNNFWDVTIKGLWLARHGSNPNRFEGTESSYNLPEA